MKRTTIILFMCLGILVPVLGLISGGLLISRILPSLPFNQTSQIELNEAWTDSDSLTAASDFCIETYQITPSNTWSNEILPGVDLTPVSFLKKTIDIPQEIRPYAVIDNQALVGRDEQGNPLINKDLITKFRTTDATSISELNPDVYIGTLAPEGRKLAPSAILKALLMTELITTYWHTGSSLCLAEETNGDGYYTARLIGSHTYFTNKKNTDPLDFSFFLDQKNGDMFIGPPDLLGIEDDSLQDTIDE